MYNKNEITMASDHISNIMGRGEDARGDAEELVKQTQQKVDDLQNMVRKADEAMSALRELNDVIQEIQNEYEDVDLTD